MISAQIISIKTFKSTWLPLQLVWETFAFSTIKRCQTVTSNTDVKCSNIDCSLSFSVWLGSDRVFECYASRPLCFTRDNSQNSFFAGFISPNGSLHSRTRNKNHWNKKDVRKVTNNEFDTLFATMPYMLL